MGYEYFLILHTVKAALFCVWIYFCLYLVYHFNDSRFMDIKGKPWLNVSGLLLGPFMVFGVYVVQVSRKAYAQGMGLSEVFRELAAGSIWKGGSGKNTRKFSDDKSSEITLLDNSGRSIEEVFSGKSKTNVSGVISLSATIIQEAIEDSASDILIDPDSDGYSIRFRIDGKLHRTRQMPSDVGGAVINSIKALSSMDISERRRPQDGAFTAKIGEGSASFRVASAGVVNGEKLSIRVLNVFSQMLPLESLGLSTKNHKLVADVIMKQSGMIIVCGPTGSGKTTSLYAMLSEINTSDRNIITVEDPVEYRMSGVSQIEINEKAGITFANTLRGILRQDPDVITVGEIRDQETAQIIVQAAHTGHLVIGTMHSGDNLTSLLRLIELGIKPVMLADAMDMIISQRLVRKLCTKCKTPAKLPAEKEAALSKRGIDVSGIMQAKGCEKCRYTGYMGREAIFDILKIDGEVKNSIACLENVSPEQLREMASKNIKSRLHKEAVKKVLRGITSYNEIKAIG